MAMEISRTKRRCNHTKADGQRCRRTFTSVNGHPTCQVCMTALARKFWAEMGCTEAEIDRIIIITAR